MSGKAAKKRHGSKKTKKGWRKVDIGDVEAYLEDKRLEERLGGPFADRKDDELFVVDTTPDLENFKVIQNCRKRKREENLKKPPRCFQILEPSINAPPDPIAKRNRHRTIEEKPNSYAFKNKLSREKKANLKAKEKSTRNKAEKNKLRSEDFSKDLWDTNDALLQGKLSSQWIAPEAKSHILVNTRNRKSALPSSTRSKPNVIPAVELPHPGMSYNPSFTDHQQLLESVASKEMELIKEEEHLQRVTTKMFRKVPLEVAQKEWMEEMSQGLPNLDPQAKTETDDKNPDCNDNELNSINPAVDRTKKKDLKTRRKAKQEREKKMERERVKREQKKLSDINRVKHFQEELKKAEAKTGVRQMKRAEQKAESVTKTKRLGRNKFKENSLEFNMASELKGSLRSIKPEGNLLSDRFVSLQKRNIMEVSAKQKKTRRAKVKRFVKRAHKIEDCNLSKNKAQHKKGVLGQ